MLTETTEVVSEAEKLGRFGILPGYGMNWVVSQASKKTNGVHIYWEKKVFGQKELEVKECVKVRPSDGRVFI